MFVSVLINDSFFVQKNGRIKRAGAYANFSCFANNNIINTLFLLVLGNHIDNKEKLLVSLTNEIIVEVDEVIK